MPLIILFLFLVIGVLIYIFVSVRQDLFVRKKPDEPEPNDPFDVIYLPDDLEKDKERRERETKG